MSEERELIARGFPLEDAITMCHSMRRTGELKELMRREEKPHTCACGGKCERGACKNNCKGDCRSCTT